MVAPVSVYTSMHVCAYLDISTYIPTYMYAYMVMNAFMANGCTGICLYLYACLHI